MFVGAIAIVFIEIYERPFFFFARGGIPIAEVTHVVVSLVVDLLNPKRPVDPRCILRIAVVWKSK
jgi:hypothetical protein